MRITLNGGEILKVLAEYADNNSSAVALNREILAEVLAYDEEGSRIEVSDMICHIDVEPIQ